MQLIQVCIWSVVIVTAENIRLSLCRCTDHQPNKQTYRQADGRTSRQSVQALSAKSSVVRKSLSITTIRFLKTIFLTSNALIGINLSYSLNMVRCQQRSQIQNEEYPSPLQNKKRPMPSSWRGKMQSDSGTGCYTLHLTLKFENVDQSR